MRVPRWSGLRRRTSRHIIRAILEGVAYSLKDTFSIFEEMKIPVTSIRLGGGGAVTAVAADSSRRLRARSGNRRRGGRRSLWGRDPGRHGGGRMVFSGGGVRRRCSGSHAHRADRPLRKP